ncbi:hypothetical protein HQ459_06420 [bacterium]|nr:hypothetical protein [bacterium]
MIHDCCPLLHCKNGAGIIANWAVWCTATHQKETLCAHLFTSLSRLQAVTVGIALVYFAFFVVIFNRDIVSGNEAIFKNFIDLFFNVLWSCEFIIVLFVGSCGST